MGRPAGFFDVEDRLAGLSKKGDELERLQAVVDFEVFRPELERAVPRADRSKGGRPPFDHVLMFKVLILQTQNSLSDERTEFYLRDRLTWMRFLGLGLGDPVPDANTLWTFREALTRASANGPVRPDHRSRSGDDQDRACQSGHQHAPPALAATPAGARLTWRWPANATKALPRLTQQPMIRPPRTPLADINTHPPANGR